MRVALIALGEIEREAATAAARAQFEGAELVWVERRDLRRRPLREVAGLRVRRTDAAVLVARDLSDARLRLTSLLLALPRARERWRMDLRGRRQRWSLAAHVADNAVPIVRHLAACLLAGALGGPLLRILSGRISERQLKPRNSRRMLYLRSQLWLGLAGGGSVAHTTGVISGLQECGVAVKVVSSDGLAGVSAPTCVVRPEIWFDGWLRELEDLAYNLAFFATAHKTARRFKPRAIYQRHTAFNVAGAVLSRLLGVPLVLEFNSSEVWKGRYWGGLRFVNAARLVERINLNAADRVIVVSNVLQDELKAAGVPARKILVNPNAVDTRAFSPDASGETVRRVLASARQDVMIGFSGTFGMWHGVPTLADAIPRVLQARTNARWLLIGDGPLRHLIPSDQRVHAVGMVPHAQVPNYLAACDILVSPHGRQADGGEFFGSPTKLYEYMAMGRPIVASRVGQIRDVLADGTSALLVEPDDSEALARAIVRLIDDACLRTKLGQAARAAAETRHTWRQNAERILACLETC